MFGVSTSREDEPVVSVGRSTGGVDVGDVVDVDVVVDVGGRLLRAATETCKPLLETVSVVLYSHGTRIDWIVARTISEALCMVNPLFTMAAMMRFRGERGERLFLQNKCVSIYAW